MGGVGVVGGLNVDAAYKVVAAVLWEAVLGEGGGEVEGATRGGGGWGGQGRVVSEE